MTISAQSETGFNVGIDVGKAQLDVVCHETGEHLLVEKGPQGIRSLIKRLRKEAIERIVVEATGRYERGLLAATTASDIYQLPSL